MSRLGELGSASSAGDQPSVIFHRFLFVVDTCLDEDNLKALRDAIVISLRV
jgi:hypothetical protein